ncbi:DUF262 domain-containing protein [Photobacterium leiognathi]|uniref:DUF262 domain-containing protein n=1 Tax=Photobacterium leiognathi TaxID=553611 RepID=UPI001EE0C69C|nr:DUF262 domain-containing protein [Photobacterium leiognathi]MCG3884117.1 DUF262 domain-containing protein [Photobacterium leiognathi]
MKCQIVDRLPKTSVKAVPIHITIRELTAYVGHDKRAYPFADRMLGRFPIVNWKRDLAWTLDDKTKFLNSVFLNDDLGSVTINGYEEVGNGIMRDMSDILLDGRERVSTMLDFMSNRFSYCDLYWRDLNRFERNRFLDRELLNRSVCCFDEKALRAEYERLRRAR